ncbi:hypothetical protein [Paenibacillus sp. sgz500958]|uniref:phage distal tail protein n=1 Tax=Paenibacillus sp. sgz500958 TaxID=3242475 RepID=UPI0036D3D951
MFGGYFNRLPFNRELTVFVLGSATLHGAGSLQGAGALIMSGYTTLHGAGLLQADFIREVSFAATLHGTAHMSADFIRERLQSAFMHGAGLTRANGSRFHIDTIQFMGDFEPGDQIIIDAKRLKFTLNGQNALHQMQGDFFDLNLGVNHITYTDAAEGRDVLIRITYQDKYV